MEKFLDENGKNISLNDLVQKASIELLRERRTTTTNLIKNFLIKAEALTETVKLKKRELEKSEQSLQKTLEKIEKLKSGDWTVLSENNSQTHADSERKG